MVAVRTTRYSEKLTTLMAVGEADTTTRQRRQLGEAAIAHATRGEWEEAVDANRQLLELGPDIDAYNRLGKALAELGRHAEALDAYEQALDRDATNRIAQRNVERLRLLSGAAKPKNGKRRLEKVPATVFIEEMGKTGRARLINLGGPRVLAPLSPGDAVDLVADGEELVARVGRATVGTVEPRIAARLLKLIASGNRYEAAITTIHEAGSDLTIIIREVFTHPDNFGKVSFPTTTAAGGSGVRPYMKGSALRYDDDEEQEEVDEDSEEVEELDTTLPEYSAEPEDEEELVEEP
jgi:tetratricopeptide (TPR) repeat protein